MSFFRSGWYLVYTKPRHEKKVQHRLSEIKIDAFLPTKKVFRTWHDRKKCVDEPLFPSYVFVHLNSMQHYYSGMETDGVLYFVRSGREIARVSEELVGNIKLAAGQAKDIEISEDLFQPGRELVINRRGLAGLACEVVQWQSRRKLLVRVDLLQRNILLTIPEEYLSFIS